MLNDTVFQGRLTRDPEVKKTQSDVSLLNFTVAWSEKYKEVETKCFLSCKAWRNTADFIGKYFKKGQEIIVQGRLETNEYTDKEGNKKSITILNVDKAHFCGSKSQQTAAAPEAAPGEFMSLTPAEEDELPFH